MSKEKYGITDAHYLCDSAIFNTETNGILRLYEICDLLNQQDQEIQELKDEIANLKDETGYIVFADGYDEFGQEVHKQDFIKYKDVYPQLVKTNKELEEQLKNAIVPKFKIGDYFIEYWDKEPSIYQYQGDKHFKCLNKKQGYHCDYVILGALLLDEDFIQQISKEEAQAKLKELKGENK